jgi:hypothetical protein
VVKPILRKLTQSEKNSLDLDRPAAEQDGLGIYDFGTGSRSAHEVSFNHATRRGYHNRSTSGTSQFSTATSASGHRAGSFVHPFQQTPRPYTPPIAASYQNSLRESEHSNSPALTEDEDQLRHPLRNTSSLSNNHRTPSLTGTTTPNPVLSPPLRIQTIQTKQPSSSRLARESHTSLQSTLVLSSEFASPTDTMSPGSAVRTSMDRGFRIRSRSDVNHTPTETVQEARRRWNERQQEKDEIAAREEIRALEKRNKKEARQIERGHRRSSASDATRAKRSKSDLTMQEKGGVIGHDYNSAPLQTPPFTVEGLDVPRRSHTTMSTTKKKTHGAWTKLMMWLRTRFIRMGKKKD